MKSGVFKIPVVWLTLLLTTGQAFADTAWLEQPLTCGQFLTEVKKRYTGVETLATLDPAQRHELETVLDVACSERFRQCKFANCKPTQPSVVVPDENYDPTIWEKRLREERREKERKMFQEALLLYDRLYQEKLVAQRQDIAAKSAAEKTHGLTWERFTMPDFPKREKKKKPKPKDAQTIPPFFPNAPDGVMPSGSINLLPPGPVYQPHGVNPNRLPDGKGTRTEDKDTDDENTE